MSEMQTVEITAEQARKWADTRSALMWHCPAFTHIFYTMMAKDGNEHRAIFSEEVPVAATDGKHIIINPKTFFEYDLMERVFVVAHEISHGIFAHCELMHKLKMQGKVAYSDGKVLDYDADTLNRAIDYVINDMLIESKVGKYNTNWLHDKTIGTHEDDVLTVYRRIFNQSQGGGGKSGQSSFDQHLSPGTSEGKDPNQAAADRNDMQWKTAIAGAVAAGRAMGKMPAALDRALTDELEPTVDWRDKIQTFFARKPGGGSYNWQKPDRRLIVRDIVAPSRSGFGSGPIVCAIDTSGSIDQKVLDLFFGELSGILEDVRPTKLYIMFCAAAVHRTDELDSGSDLLDVRQAGAPGGGGTSFVPVFEEIEALDLQPDALIYLTDGYGRFPDTAPTYSVLWGDISGGKVKYPFGEVVELPEM